MNDLICIACVVGSVLFIMGIFVISDKIMNRRYRKKKAKLRAAYTKFFSVYDTWHKEHALSSENHNKQYELKDDMDRLIKENQYLPAYSDLFESNCEKICQKRDELLQLMLEDKIIQYEIATLAHQMNNMDRPKDYQVEYH